MDTEKLNKIIEQNERFFPGTGYGVPLHNIKPNKRAEIVESPNYGKALSWQQFKDILQYIESKHTFRKAIGKCIKYVRPDLDMRTHDVFHVKFDGFPNSKEFDFRDNETDMYDCIIEWLES